MKAEEYLNNLGLDIAHIPDILNNDDKSIYYTHSLMEQYANQRVIEELDEQRNKLLDKYVQLEIGSDERVGLSIALADIELRVNELKQESRGIPQ